MSDTSQQKVRQTTDGSRLFVPATGRWIENLTGQRFGIRTVEHHLGGQLWQVRCDCGRVSSVYSFNLKKGASYSCGCVGRGRPRSLQAIRTPGLPPRVSALSRDNATIECYVVWSVPDAKGQCSELARFASLDDLQNFLAILS